MIDILKIKEARKILSTTDIELTFKVYDSNDWSADPVGKETIHVYPYGEENAVAFVREAQATDNVIIDNLCQIAHNVEIGYGTAIAGATTFAGSTKVGKYCIIGGASVFNGHIEICDQATITGMAMVMRSITEPGIYSSGIPAQTNKEWRKTAARTLHIDDIHKRLSNVEKLLDKQEQK